MSNQDDTQSHLLADDIEYAYVLTTYENPDQFDTADTVLVEGEVEVAMLTPDQLDNDEYQWYAQELRRTCGDDVAAEELSRLTVELFVL